MPQDCSAIGTATFGCLSLSFRLRQRQNGAAEQLNINQR